MGNERSALRLLLRDMKLAWYVACMVIMRNVRTTSTKNLKKGIPMRIDEQQNYYLFLEMWIQRMNRFVWLEQGLNAGDAASRFMLGRKF